MNKIWEKDTHDKRTECIGNDSACDALNTYVVHRKRTLLPLFTSKDLRVDLLRSVEGDKPFYLNIT